MAGKGKRHELLTHIPNIKYIIYIHRQRREHIILRKVFGVEVNVPCS